MSLNRSTIRSAHISAALFAGVTAASSVGAQERTLFSLRSTVDREVVIVMRGRDVQVRGSGLDASYRPQLDLREALPSTGGNVYVRLVDGRGTLQVLEQPSSRNGYTTTLRIVDNKSGQDNYAFVASWRPTGNDGYGDRNGRGRDDDRRGDRDSDGWNDRDGRGRDDNCDHPNRNNGRGRDDDRCDDRNRGDNDRWDRDRNDGMLGWSGDVDDVSEIRITGRRVEYRTRSGAPIRNARYDLRGAGLPNREVTLALGVSNGRGAVQVVQQPHRSNGYTAIVRITDRRSGYGTYDFNLKWQ